MTDVLNTVTLIPFGIIDENKEYNLNIAKVYAPDTKVHKHIKVYV